MALSAHPPVFSKPSVACGNALISVMFTTYRFPKTYLVSGLKTPVFGNSEIYFSVNFLVFCVTEFLSKYFKFADLIFHKTQAHGADMDEFLQGLRTILPIFTVRRHPF